MKQLQALLFLSMALFQCTSNHSGTMNLKEVTIDQLQAGYAEGRFTTQEVVQHYLAEIERIDQNGPSLRSILTLNPDALAIATQLDEERRQGKLRGPLHGIPVVLKDNIDTHDQMPTTAGARAMANSFPLQDSWVAARLREAGAVILGKSNLSEWANFHSTYASSGWSGLGGQTLNPYDLTRSPCGSSSGSGVAVAANLCVLSIGTETNGSIVCPANNNGIVGIKPTVGLISRSGIIPISFTQDTPGPMARTVKDAALCLNALTGIDPQDSKTSASQGKVAKDYTRFLNPNGLKGKRIGLYKQPMGIHFKADQKMEEAIAFLKAAGATIIEIEQLSEINIEPPSFEVMLYEFKDGLNAYFAGLGPNAPVKNLADLIRQTQADPEEMAYFDHALLSQAQAKGDLQEPAYLQALKQIKEYSQAKGIDRIMDQYQLDALVAPTGGPAWKTDWAVGDHYGVYSSSPAAIAGYPSISVPMGLIDGLPVGISFFGRAWSEGVLIELAYAYEQGTRHRVAPEFKASNPF
ncbi:MAG: amidase [Saprospiraceae bacterium]